MRLSRQDRVNQATWAKASSRQWLDHAQGYTDEGERVALAAIADEVRGTPILDLGVGMGRTIPMLRPWTDDYRAIDYLPSMVDEARRRHPEARVDVGDARSLDGLPSAHFGFVYFSFNGIDAVGQVDRQQIFRAAHRVLRPNGLFVFSTLNLEGPPARQRPWHIAFERPARPLRVARTCVGAALDLVNWLRLERETRRGPGWAVATLSAHHYGILVHFTSLARQLEELRTTGFAPDADVFDDRTGARLTVGDDLSQVAWFNIVARRRSGE